VISKRVGACGDVRVVLPCSRAPPPPHPPFLPLDRCHQERLVQQRQRAWGRPGAKQQEPLPSCEQLTSMNEKLGRHRQAGYAY
jgi:hypothetical protein